MYGTCWGCCVLGIEGTMIRVEVDVCPGLPVFSIVGLPDGAVREAADRVRAALKNQGFSFPLGRVTVNLAPADVRKEGAVFDLAIAVGILLTTGQWQSRDGEQAMFIGELSLKGEMRAVKGVLSMMMAAQTAEITTVYVPYDNIQEAMLVQGMRVIPLRTLGDVRDAVPYCADAMTATDGARRRIEEEVGDYADVSGLFAVKRGLMIAAAGMHNVMLVGPPGAGKTMLLRRLPTVLTPLTEAESLEVMRMYSARGLCLVDESRMWRRPFRSPHHTISPQGLIGGGSRPEPGEVSLAHHGVLFLDECAEFRRTTLECLRQPLEERSVTVARVRAKVTFPTQVMLVATMNPCPCGYDGYEDPVRTCTCTARMKRKYMSHLSGPLLDRLDMHMDVPRLRSGEVRRLKPSITMTSAMMRDIVARTQAFAAQRNERYGLRYNAMIPSPLLATLCALSPTTHDVLADAYELMELSPRAHDRLLRIARTIADMDESEEIAEHHMREALFYRSLDQRWLRLQTAMMGERTPSITTV